MHVTFVPNWTEFNLTRVNYSDCKPYLGGFPVSFSVIKANVSHLNTSFIKVQMSASSQYVKSLMEPDAYLTTCGSYACDWELLRYDGNPWSTVTHGTHIGAMVQKYGVNRQGKGLLWANIHDAYRSILSAIDHFAKLDQTYLDHQLLSILNKVENVTSTGTDLEKLLYAMTGGFNSSYLQSIFHEDKQTITYIVACGNISYVRHCFEGLVFLQHTNGSFEATGATCKGNSFMTPITRERLHDHHRLHKAVMATRPVSMRANFIWSALLACGAAWAVMLMIWLWQKVLLAIS